MISKNIARELVIIVYGHWISKVYLSKHNHDFGVWLRAFH